jgi:uncharacterized protein
VLVPLFLNEPHNAADATWYAREKGELATAAWCVPEFASALGIKQRTAAVDAHQAQGAWARFERMVAVDLRQLLVEPASFHRAAERVLDTTSGLRAGDALHPACAESAGAKHMATPDDVLSRKAQRLKIKPVALCDPPSQRRVGSK